MSTNVLSSKEIKREWHLIDAKNKVVGRVATEVATLLMGKHKPQFVPYLDTGDFVVVINASQVKVSAKKTLAKHYIHHSGYPGGYKEINLAALLQKKPEEVIIHAVKGMVPGTKLGKEMLKKLHVFPGSEHTYKNQLKEKENGSKP